MMDEHQHRGEQMNERAKRAYDHVRHSRVIALDDHGEKIMSMPAHRYIAMSGAALIGSFCVGLMFGKKMSYLMHEKKW